MGMSSHGMNSLSGAARMSASSQGQIESWLQAKVDQSDLVQQTLLEAHRGLNNFRGSTDGEWLAWLKRIVQTNAADFVRRYGKAGKHPAAREVSLDARAGDDSEGPTRDPGDSGQQTPSQIVLRREEELEISQAVLTAPRGLPGGDHPPQSRAVCRSTKSPNAWAARTRRADALDAGHPPKLQEIVDAKEG